LVDGVFTAFGQENISITNSPENELWAPQQQLTITISNDDLTSVPENGDTVKLVTENAVAATEQVVVF
jgi:flagellar protein FlaF